MKSLLTTFLIGILTTIVMAQDTNYNAGQGVEYRRQKLIQYYSTFDGKISGFFQMAARLRLGKDIEKCQEDFAKRLGMTKVKGAKLYGPIILGNNTTVDERAILYRGIKWGSGYVGKDASLIGAIIGYAAEIKDKASVLEKAVIGSRSIIKDGIKIHPSVKIMTDEIIDIDRKNTEEE